MVHTYIVGFLRTTKLPINKLLCSTGQLGMHLRIEVMQLLSIAVKCLLHNALYIMHFDVLQQTLLLPVIHMLLCNTGPIYCSWNCI